MPYKHSVVAVTVVSIIITV